MIIERFYRIKNLEHSKVLLLTATSGVKVGSEEGKGRLAGKLDSFVKLISCHGQQIRTVRPSEN